MATTALPVVTLVHNTPSADLLDANGVAATTPADGWVIAAAGIEGGRLLIKLLADATGDTVTFLAGDNPPSHRKGLGNLAVVLAASDVRYLVLESGRFLQDDGTILATCTDAGTTLHAFLLPKT